MPRMRIIGTVEAAIEIEESLLGRKLPTSFRNWLLENNSLGVGETYIYPVRDERDTRKTWNSLSYNLQHDWKESLAGFEVTRYVHLLPFADATLTDYFCFDYSQPEDDGERPVVLWLQETGEVKPYAANFDEFKSKIVGLESNQSRRLNHEVER